MSNVLGTIAIVTALLAQTAPATKPAATQPADDSPRRIEALLEPIRAKHELPALAAAVVRGGRMTAIGAVGVRARGHDAAVTIDDRFHLGSCTKSMTATMIARLVEAGKLRWDIPMSEALPDLRETMDPAYRPVTLAQLLAHRGGVPGNPPPEVWGKLFRDRASTPGSRKYFVEETLRRPPAAAPGTKFEYSNAGYVIAGYIAERAGGNTWEALIQELLFTPLDMRSAGFGPPAGIDKHDQPWGHRGVGSAAVAVPSGLLADNPPALGPAGTVHAALGDWAKYVALHLSAARGEARLLKPESFTKLQAPLDDGEYALGWLVTQRPWAKGKTLTHSGSNTIWFCVVWIGPGADIAVLVATNQGDAAARQGCDDAAAALLRDSGALR